MNLNSLRRKIESFSSCYNVNVDLWFDCTMTRSWYLDVFGYSDSLWVARDFINPDIITRREVTEILHRLIRSLNEKVILK